MKMEVGQKLENMGKPINTKESDKSPFIHTDSRTFILFLSLQIIVGELEILIFFILNKMKKRCLGRTKEYWIPD